METFSIDMDALFDTVSRAASQNPEVMARATSELQHHQTVPGFHAGLQHLFVHGVVDNPDVRLLACLFFKNGLDRYWRPTADNAIDEKEKSVIRERLILALDEPDERVAKQLAVIISRLARQDVPTNWPALIPALLEAVCSGDGLRHVRGLLYTYHTLKALSSRRLLAARQTFTDVADELFPFLHELWNRGINDFAAAISAPEGVNPVELLVPLERTRLVLKSLRQLLKHGMRRFHENAAGALFFEQLLTRLPEFVELRRTLPAAVLSTELEGGPELVELVDKTIAMMLKTVADGQAYEPISFAHFMAPALELVLAPVLAANENEVAALEVAVAAGGNAATVASAGDDSRGSGGGDVLGCGGDRPPMERYYVLCMCLAKDVLNCGEYRPLRSHSSRSGGTGGSVVVSSRTASVSDADMEVHQAAELLGSIFTPTVLTQLVRALVLRFMPLSASDLELWSEAPEEFHQAAEEVSDSWRTVLRPCAGKLLGALMSRFTEPTATALLELGEELLPAPVDTMQAVLLKDSMLAAVGRCAYDLYDYVPFDEWFLNSLVPLVEASGREWPLTVLRRRVAWVAGGWVAVKMGHDVRPQLYRILLHLLGERSEDLAVRLAAAETLRRAVDDFGFTLEAFADHFEPLVLALFQLLQTTERGESKLRVLTTLRVIIERLGIQHTEAAAALVAEYMPQLWEDAAGHNLLQTSVVETLTLLVQALNATVSDWYGFLLPIVAFAVDPHEEASVYLLEPALELWLEVMKRDEVLRPELLELFARLPPLLERGAEWVRTCVHLCESYLLLGGEPFLAMHGSLLSTAAGALVSDTDARNELRILACRLVDLALTAHPLTATPIFEDVLVYAVAQVIAAEELHPALFGAYAALAARVLVGTSPETFNTLLASAGVAMGVTEMEEEGSIEANFWDRWLDRFDAVSSPTRRKLMGLAMGVALSQGSRRPHVLDRFQRFFSAIVTLLHELHIRQGEPLPVDFLATAMNASPSSSIDGGVGGADGVAAAEEKEAAGGVITLSRSSSSGSSSEPVQAQAQRKRSLAAHDPVHSVNFRVWVAQHFHSLEATAGPEIWASLMAQTHPDEAKQLERFL